MSERYDHGIDLDYFIEHQDELVAKYNGKRLLMRNAEVVGVFNGLGEAMDEGERLFGRNRYSVQECKPGEEAYTIEMPCWLLGAPVCV